MPTIVPVPRTPLTDAERPHFVAWARALSSFRACTREEAGAAAWSELLGGTVLTQRRYGNLGGLVERWRSLGRPEARVRRPGSTRRRSAAHLAWEGRNGTHEEAPDAR